MSNRNRISNGRYETGPRPPRTSCHHVLRILYPGDTGYPHAAFLACTRVISGITGTEDAACAASASVARFCDKRSVRLGSAKVCCYLPLRQLTFPASTMQRLTVPVGVVELSLTRRTLVSTFHTQRHGNRDKKKPIPCAVLHTCSNSVCRVDFQMDPSTGAAMRRDTVVGQA